MRRFTVIVVIIVAVAAFGYGLWQLFDLRFARGDIYPPGSSFRADPLGTRALYESFDLLPRVKTERLLEPIRLLGSGRGTTLFILACYPSDEPILSTSDASELDELLAQGGRVVVTFSPTSGRPFWSGLGTRRATTTLTNSPARRTGLRRKAVSASGELDNIAFTTLWSFQFDYPALAHGSNGLPVLEHATRTEDSPEILPPRACLAFGGGVHRARYQLDRALCPQQPPRGRRAHLRARLGRARQ